MGPQVLEEILQALPLPRDPRLLVGPELRDDAAVYELEEGRALVFTTDFFPPLVDDPRTFGTIAAANALSDVYAMGGKPLLALYLVGFPLEKLPLSALEEILKGAGAVLKEAGCLGVGGHSLATEEPLFGLAVVGEVNPENLFRNSEARPGDRLFLTKPLGSGILATAYKRGRIGEEGFQPAIEVMCTLNRRAAEVATSLGKGAIHAMTDVTGFGLLGHLLEMVKGANLPATLDLSRLPFLPGVLELARERVLPGGARRNLEYVAPCLREQREEDPRFWGALDPQTNGGLLLAVAEEAAAELRSRFSREGLVLEELGYVEQGERVEISLQG